MNQRYWGAVLCASLLLAGCNSASSARNAKKDVGSTQPAMNSDHAQSRKVITASLADALNALGTATGLDIEFRDERKNTTHLNRPVEIQFTEGEFWADLARIESLFHVRLQWLGKPDQSGKAILRLSDENPEILAAYAKERFRIIASVPQLSRVQEKAKPNHAVVELILNYLPGDRVLAASWRPDNENGLYVTKSVPHWGQLELGSMPSTKKNELTGSVDVVVGTKWEWVTLLLSPGSTVSLTPSNPIEELRFAQLAGTDFVGPPGSGFDLDKKGARKLAAFIVKFTATGSYQGVLPCVPSECDVVDADGTKHQASEIGVENDGSGKKLYYAVFPVGRENTVPVKLEACVPVRTHNISLRISDMLRLPYGSFRDAN